MKEYSEFAAQIHWNSCTNETTDDFVFQLSELAKQPPAPAKRWFYNNDEAIYADERKYIDNKQDLWALVPRKKTPLRRLLERSGRFRTFALWKQPDEKRPIHYEYITYTSDKRINRFLTIIIVAVRTVMLVILFWILSVIYLTKVKLGIITGFNALVLGLMTAATNARPFETLGATAAGVIFCYLIPTYTYIMNEIKILRHANSIPPTSEPELTPVLATKRSIQKRKSGRWLLYPCSRLNSSARVNPRCWARKKYCCRAIDTNAKRGSSQWHRVGDA